MDDYIENTDLEYTLDEYIEYLDYDFNTMVETVQDFTKIYILYSSLFLGLIIALFMVKGLLKHD